MESTAHQLMCRRFPSMLFCAVTMFMVFMFAASTFAQDTKPKENGPAEGHSYHGEAFNEGPRQSAYLMKSTGNISFPVTTKSKQAQEFFNQGVGALHGFWYFEAERSFRQVAMIDPDCAMAYWGMAKANSGNSKRAKGFIAEAVKRKSGASRREQMYIDLTHTYLNADSKKDKERKQAYMDGVRKIIEDFPDDIEAKALLVVTQWKNNGKIKIKDHDKVNSMIEEILEVNPMHSVHHYRIHLWDYKKPANALASAARCGQAAPGIAHMWHMPGHTYSKLKRYADAAWQQEASARVDHAHMMRDRVLPDQIHNFAHNNEWLVRNLIHLGRVDDALDLAKNMTELPRHPKYNTLRKGSARYGRDRLYGVLTQFELWDVAVELCNSVYLTAGDSLDTQVKHARLLGSAYYMTGELDLGDTIAGDLEKKLAEKRKSAAAEKKKSDAAKKGKKKGRRSSTPADRDIKSLGSAIHLLAAYRHQRNGDHVAAMASFKQVPGLGKSVLARAHSSVGEHEKAISLAAENVKSKSGVAWALADQVYLLNQAGKQEEAFAALTKLRAVGASADLDAPVFARVAPIAAAMDLPADWRKLGKKPDDLLERPDLDSIGPFRWQPTAAADWTLPNHQGKSVSLADYRGQPVLVVFYLGFGCLHCVEQLNVIAPLADQFADAGIEIVAVSTDKLNGLGESVKAYTEDGAFPFTILSNTDLDVFRAYRAYDDFEKMALHGTFLIDEEGLVRWQDISYEPFMDTKFLLEEAKRLLASKHQGSASNATPGTSPRP